MRLFREQRPPIAFPRAFWTAFGLLAALHALWMASPRVLPFVDLPFHLAAATILRNLGRTGNCFAEFYEIPTLLTSNVFHLIFCGSPFFPSVEFANRVFYVLTVVLLPVSVLLLIRRVGGNPWLSLLAFLFVYNFNVFWGFTGYSIGIPVTILFLVAVVDYCNRPSPWLGAGLGLFLLFIFFVHYQVALFAGLVFAVSVLIAFWRRPAVVALSALAGLPVLAVMAWSYARMDHAGYLPLTADLANYYRWHYLQRFDDRLFQFLTLDFYWLYNPPKGRSFARVFYLVAALPLVVYALARCGALFKRAPRPGPGAELGGAGLRPAPRIHPVVTAFFVSSMLCFWLLPRDLHGQAVVYQRFMVFLALSVVVATGSFLRLEPSSRSAKVLAAYLILAAAFHLSEHSRYFARFGRRLAGFGPDLFPAGRTCKVLAPLQHNIYYRGLPVFLHSHMYYTVWKRGIACGLVDYRFGAVRRKVGVERLPPYQDWLRRPPEPECPPGVVCRALLEQKGYQGVDYLLVKNEEPVTVEGFWETTRRNEWQLFQREQ